MSVAKVVIKDATVVSRTVGGSTFQNQNGILVTSPDEALGIEISLPRGGQPYAAGSYLIDGKSFDRDQYGRPCFGKRGLVLILEGKAS